MSSNTDPHALSAALMQLAAQLAMDGRGDLAQAVRDAHDDASRLRWLVGSGAVTRAQIDRDIVAAQEARVAAGR